MSLLLPDLVTFSFLQATEEPFGFKNINVEKNLSLTKYFTTLPVCVSYFFTETKYCLFPQTYPQWPLLLIRQLSNVVNFNLRPLILKLMI